MLDKYQWKRLTALVARATPFVDDGVEWCVVANEFPKRYFGSIRPSPTLEAEAGFGIDPYIATDGVEWYSIDAGCIIDGVDDDFPYYPEDDD